MKTGSHSDSLPSEQKLTNCADCGGYDIEWMRRCFKHVGVEFCRGCECPFCAEDDLDDYYGEAFEAIDDDE